MASSKPGTGMHIGGYSLKRYRYKTFKKTHKGSEEELADTKQAYLDFKGDMDQIMESGLCVQYTD